MSFGDLLRFGYITSQFSCLCMPMLTSNSSGNMQKHGYLGCFYAASARENISSVWVIIPFHKDFSPSGEQLELRKLARELNQPTAVVWQHFTNIAALQNLALLQQV